MPTSSRAGEPRLAVLAGESAALVLLGALSVAVCWPGDLARHLHPHPLWAVVLLPSVRYGLRGIAVALPIAFGALWAAGAVAPSFGGRWPLADLATLSLMVVVSWIAEAQHARRRALERTRRDLEERLREQDATLAELAKSAQQLRVRVDQVDASLSFQRAVAEGLESGDAVAAAQAALELATARLGASGGVVLACSDGRLDELAATADAAGTAANDRTAQEAARRGRVVDAVELDDRDAGDSDLAAPICDDDGTVLGVIGLYGVSPTVPTGWVVRELSMIADWCTKSLGAARSRRAPRRHGGRLT